MLSILAVGRDERLLDTRAAVLRRTTAEVTQARPDIASELLKVMRFDLVILCHSLSLDESTEIAEAAHRWPESVHVLQVVTGALWDESYEGVPVEVVTGEPERLVEKVIVLSRVVDRPLSKRATILHFRPARDVAS